MAVLGVSSSMIGIIYKITNRINGKIYIGQTIRKFEVRWKEHSYDSRNDNPLYNSIKKYGNSAFSKEIIGTYYSMEDLNNAEEYYIQYHNSLSPNGYNLHTGGNNHTTSEDTKIKISKAISGEKNGNFGKVFSNEIRLKISNANKGKKRSECFKLKRSEYMKANHPSKGQFSSKLNEEVLRNSNEKRKIQIFCPELNIYFESIGAASRELKISKSNIGLVASGKYKQVKGLTFLRVSK